MSFQLANLKEPSYVPQAAAAAIYTSPAKTSTLFTHPTFTNNGTVPVKLTLWILPSGVVATANQYLLVNGVFVPAASTTPGGPSGVYISPEMTQLIIGPGDAIWGLADTLNALIFTASGAVIV